MKLGFSPITAGITDYREAFELAAELDLFLEIGYDVHEMFPELPGPNVLAEMGRAAGVGFSVHLPFVDLNPTSLVEPSRRVSLDRTLRSLDFSEQLGAMVGVLHTGQIPIRHPMVLDRAHALLSSALAALSNPPIPVALENLALDAQDLLQTPQELASLGNTLGSGFGYCLDLAHALVKRDKAAILDYHQAMAPRLLHLHLHDNHGITDDHLPVGAGRLPWEDLRSDLAGFNGTAALEVQGGAGAVRSSLVRLSQAWELA